MTDDQLAAAIGISPRALRAIRHVESGHNPAAVRFEPHVFRRMTKGRFDALVPYTPGPHGPSHVAAETDRAAFDRAFALSPAQAVCSTSFGAYQVLGGTLLRMWPGAGPGGVVANFDGDPVGTGNRAVARWFKNRPRAVAAVNLGDWFAFAGYYNGAGRNQRHYADMLEEAARNDH